MYYLNLLLFVVFVYVIFLMVTTLRNFLQERRVKGAVDKPFPKNYEEVLVKIPYFQRLSSDEQEKIKRSIVKFIVTKEFTGVKIEVTDEIRVVVAFYACLLLLKIETDNCYDNLLTIIVYPHHVVYDMIRESGGVYSKEPFLLEGQSANDTVVISWSDAKKEAYHIDKENVIIHEFAHEIDYLDGEADGIPPLSESRYSEWSRVLYENFNKLQAKAIANRYWGKYKILGSYAATNEAEFFAVATERFFQTPNSLQKHFPDLYKELKEFYKIDPATLLEQHGKDGKISVGNL